MSRSVSVTNTQRRTPMCRCAITFRTGSHSTALTASNRVSRGEMAVLMRVRVYALIFAAIVWVSPPGRAQDSTSPVPTIIQPAQPIEVAPPPTSNTVMRTNAMDVLDDKKKLGRNDYVSFRVVEDRDNDSQRLRVNDSGELEVPYVGLVPAEGKSCKELAYRIKGALEKEYYYHATVILALDRVGERARGRVSLSGHA